jgi:hyaluronan synthase
VAPGQAARAALADRYDIPRAYYRRRITVVAVGLAAAVTCAALYRHALFVEAYRSYRPLMVIWSAAFAFVALQWLLSWRDRPFTVTPLQQERLGRLRVVVNIPNYNEDPATLDRALYAVFSQTRPPDVVEVVDDGSTEDYAAVRDFWENHHPPGTAFSWVRQANGGKKHAQANTFGRYPDADVFVTLDSDTALDRRAIEEGLKPFADRRVQSVAGIELAHNSQATWLTRTVSARSLFFQVVACGAQSACGDVLVNRGAFALYRAPLIRGVIRAYLDETFLGMAVRLGDDAALTLFARGRGRAVQQPTAFAFTMYPETLSHHLRQWVRWMRGSTIRNCWRLRYLPLTSYGWWFTFLGFWFFLSSTIVTVLAAATWPASAGFDESGIVAMLAWAYMTALRTLCIHRSDEGRATRLATLLYYPAAMLWAAAVLRPLRFWGIATYRRQGWTTRQDVEIAIAAPAMQGASA